jgi:hypothetical protein
MERATFSRAGFEIMVRAERNSRNAWIAHVEVRRDAQSLINGGQGTVQPEWLTAEEAVRDGIDWARRMINQRFEPHDASSWVVARSHAATWFRKEEEAQTGRMIAEVHG